MQMAVSIILFFILIIDLIALFFIPIFVKVMWENWVAPQPWLYDLDNPPTQYPMPQDQMMNAARIYQEDLWKQNGQNPLLKQMGRYDD